VNSFALACSHDGSVIVGYSKSSAFRWTQATGMVDIGSLPATTITEAYDVSADGAIVIGRSIGNPNRQGPQSFLWREGHPMMNLADVLTEELGVDLDGWFLTAYAISADGSTIVGQAFDGLTLYYPFIAVIGDRCLESFDLDADGATTAEDVYLALAEPSDLNNDGFVDAWDALDVAACARHDELDDLAAAR
jgi:probable HAF family extracellular repeat protein